MLSARTQSACEGNVLSLFVILSAGDHVGRPPWGNPAEVGMAPQGIPH